MGVYIKGMDMPESCHQCVAGYGGFCFVCPAEEDGTCPDHGRPEWCPLIGLPAQHGRLVDAYEMQGEWYRLNFNRKISDGTLAYWNFQLSKIPTVIEAEGEDV